MSTSRLFTYNTGTTISGTSQVGNLAICDDFTVAYSNPEFQWWNGPIEDIGYVIAHPTPSGNQPNQESKPAYLGFLRSEFLTDESFLSLCYSVAQTNQYFVTPNQAKLWLNGEGLWNSYPSGTNVIFYSGETYNPIWVSGLTITAASTNYNTYSYDVDSLNISFGVGGLGLITDTWQTFGSYDFTGYQYLVIDVNLSYFGGGVGVRLILTNGDESLYTEDMTDNGYHTISLDISSWIGVGQIQIQLSGSGNGFQADLEIFSVFIES